MREVFVTTGVTSLKWCTNGRGSSALSFCNNETRMLRTEHRRGAKKTTAGDGHVREVTRILVGALTGAG